LKTKKIIIEDESMVTWSIENHYTINLALYDTIFDFVKSDKSSYPAMRIYSFGDIDMDGTDVVTDFTIVRTDMDMAIQKLLEAFEGYEEYDKCAKILKLQKSLEN
jgi:hypothetical protein|tara:strand:+ start:916 stop:1230 length:315 start_codon:yes stop_codon:yes gene_type:complete